MYEMPMTGNCEGVCWLFEPLVKVGSCDPLLACLLTDAGFTHSSHPGRKQV